MIIGGGGGVTNTTTVVALVFWKDYRLWDWGGNGVWVSLLKEIYLSDQESKPPQLSFSLPLVVALPMKWQFMAPFFSSLSTCKTSISWAPQYLASLLPLTNPMALLHKLWDYTFPWSTTAFQVRSPSHQGSEALVSVVEDWTGTPLTFNYEVTSRDLQKRQNLQIVRPNKINTIFVLSNNYILVHNYIKYRVWMLCNFFIRKNHDMFHDVTVFRTKVSTFSIYGNMSTPYPT